MTLALSILLTLNAIAFVLWLSSMRVRVIVGLPSSVPTLPVARMLAWTQAWVRPRISQLRDSAQSVSHWRTAPDPALRRLADAIRSTRAISPMWSPRVAMAGSEVIGGSESVRYDRPTAAVTANDGSVIGPQPEPVPTEDVTRATTPPRRPLSDGEARLVERIARLRQERSVAV